MQINRTFFFPELDRRSGGRGAYHRCDQRLKNASHEHKHDKMGPPTLPVTSGKLTFHSYYSFKFDGNDTTVWPVTSVKVTFTQVDSL